MVNKKIKCGVSLLGGLSVFSSILVAGNVNADQENEFLLEFLDKLNKDWVYRYFFWLFFIKPLKDLVVERNIREVFSDSKNVPVDKKEDYSKNLEYYVKFGDFIRMLREDISLFSKEGNSEIYTPRFDLFLDGKKVKKILIDSNNLVIDFAVRCGVISISEQNGNSKKDLLRCIKKIEKIYKKKKYRLQENFERNERTKNFLYESKLGKFINMVKIKENLFKEASCKVYNENSKQIEERKLGFYRPTFDVFVGKNRVNYICFENNNLVIGFEDFNRDFSICEQHGNSKEDLFLCMEEIKKAARRSEKNQNLYNVGGALPVVCENSIESEAD